MKSNFFLTLLISVFVSATLTASDNIFKVEELYAKKSELNNKIVSTKGKVVKKSSAIMGKDWFHIQDDSKTEKKNTVIFKTKTGSSNVLVGDIVIAKGTLKADVDIGAGYFYEVLMEDSTFTKQ